MLAEISAGLSSLSAAGEIARGLLGMKVSTEVTARIHDIQSKLIDAQAQILSLQSKYSDIEKVVSAKEAEIESLKQWDREKDRYTLTKTAAGTLVYELRAEVKEEGEPVHSLCPHCYTEGFKSILQATGIMANCLRCHSTLTVKESPRVVYRVPKLL